MTFPYYNRLSPAKKRIYRQSAKITTVPLAAADALRPLVVDLRGALEEGHRARTETSCSTLISALCLALDVPPLKVKVLAARPSHSWGELHGLYTRPDNSQRATITVWMRTAQRRQIVSFRTFLRTVVHEVLHHLDYELFTLADSLHTEGFFQRESSIIKQLDGPKPAP